MKDRANPRRSVSSLFDPAIIVPAIGDSFRKLHPRNLVRNPVMFVVEIVTVLTTILYVRDLLTGGENLKFTFQIIVWLWITLLFANFAEAVAEGRGKAQAATLRKARTDTRAKRLIDPNGKSGMKDVIEGVSAIDLAPGDVVLVEPGDLIPSDGDVIEGVASVDESAITGESAPVIREAGGDRSAVTGGTVVLSDWIKVRITAAQGSTFLDRMIALVEGAERQKTPNEIALNILLAGLTIIFVIAVATIPSFANYAGGSVSVVVLVALFVTLIPTTIGALLSAIGIAGMDRLGAIQCFGHVGTGGRSRRRRRHAASRQDRDNHSRQPPGHGIYSAAWRQRKGTRGRGATRLASRRNARRPLDCRARKGEIRHSGPRDARASREVCAVFRLHTIERGRYGYNHYPQGSGGRDTWPSSVPPLRCPKIIQAPAHRQRSPSWSRTRRSKL